MRSRSQLLALALLVPFQAQAAQTFHADIAAVNGSSITGFIDFLLDGTSLSVNLQASGLDDGVHFLHIHGLDSAPGTPVNTTPPPPPVPPNGDIDGNGVLTTGEAKKAIGGVILSLAPHTPGVSAELTGVTSTGGLLSFTYTYDLTQDIFEPGYGIADLLPLDFRVFDIHGGIVPAGIVLNGTTTAPGTYDPNLPIGAGKILLTSEMPEPASWAMMIGGFGLVGATARRRMPARVRFG